MRARPRSRLCTVKGVAIAMLGATLAAPIAASAQITQGEYAARRDSLVARVSDGVIIALGAQEPREDYLAFWQDPFFRYLTGFNEPDAALVMVKRGGRATSTMFVEPRDPAREVWTGHRAGPDGVASVTGMNARNVTELKAALDSLIGTDSTKVYVVGDYTEDGEVVTATDRFIRSMTAAHPHAAIIPADDIVRDLRGRKSSAELALIHRAVSITMDAQRAAMSVVAPGRKEYEAQAIIEYTFRRNGAERPSFATIVGSGPNSTTLHYNADDRVMNAGDVVVMDIGASYAGYAADVTRTVPVSGHFTPDQRAVYQAVRNTQAAAERQAVLGAPARRMVDTANAVIAHELAKLGLIESDTATYACRMGDVVARCRQYRLYYMHGLGHGIGLDVHDPGTSGVQDGTIRPGDAFTIEPGIYVRANTVDIIDDLPENRALRATLRPVVERYRNIGVRIEDDYLATPAGVEWVSRVPREADEVEALMRVKPAAAISGVVN